MKFDELNKDNFLLFAIKYYENPIASTQEEFELDLNKFKYVKRCLKKYHNSGKLNTHLLLNHIKVIFNCWDDASIPMLFYKLDRECWPYLKSFLIYLDRIPNSPVTDIHNIQEDLNILRSLKGF